MGPPGLAYLAHALYALVPVLTEDVETMTVDEHWRVYVHPGWLAASDVPTVAGELAHVTWHLLLDHADRARDQHVDARTAQPWHEAADLTVRQILDGGAIASELPYLTGMAPGRSAEEYFAIISRLPATLDDELCDLEGPPTGCGSGCDGLRRDHELPPGADAGEVEPEEARHIRRRVAIEFTEHCTRIGTDPGDAGRWAKQILEPTIAWEPLLAGAVRRAAGWAHGHAEYTYARPSRRAGAVKGIVLPSTRRPMPSVAMVIDTSGSVDDTLLGSGARRGRRGAPGAGGQRPGGQRHLVRRRRDPARADPAGARRTAGRRRWHGHARRHPRRGGVAATTGPGGGADRRLHALAGRSPARGGRRGRPAGARAGSAAADAEVGDARRVLAGVRSNGRNLTMWWIGRR